MLQIIKYICLLILCCWACTNTKPPKSNEVQTIDLRFDRDTTNFISMVDSVTFIPLQTTEESIIGKISRAFYVQGKYYISDSQQQRVLIFDETGKYISRLDKQGKGPCEYVGIHDLFIDASGMIRILSQTSPAKVIGYDPRGSVCEEMVVGGWSGDRIFPFGEGYIFYSASGSSQPEKRFFLFSTDAKGNIRHKQLPSHDYVEYAYDTRSFSSYGDTVLFHKPFDNNVYQILPQGDASVRYALNYGKHQMPEAVKEEFQKSFRYFMEHAGDGYILKLDYFYETSGFLVLSYLTENGGSPFFGVYVKKDKKMVVPNVNNIVTIAMSDPVGMSDHETFISYLDISDFHESGSLSAGAYDYLFDAFPGLGPIVHTLPETANPVLMKYKFKIP